MSHDMQISGARPEQLLDLSYAVKEVKLKDGKLENRLVIMIKGTDTALGLASKRGLEGVRGSEVQIKGLTDKFLNWLSNIFNTLDRIQVGDKHFNVERKSVSHFYDKYKSQIDPQGKTNPTTEQKFKAVAQFLLKEIKASQPQQKAAEMPPTPRERALSQPQAQSAEVVPYRATSKQEQNVRAGQDAGIVVPYKATAKVHERRETISPKGLEYVSEPPSSPKHAKEAVQPNIAPSKPEAPAIQHHVEPAAVSAAAPKGVSVTQEDANALVRKFLDKKLRTIGLGKTETNVMNIVKESQDKGAAKEMIKAAFEEVLNDAEWLGQKTRLDPKAIRETVLAPLMQEITKRHG